MGNHNSGRRPQPTALRALRGNPSKTRVNEHEPRPPVGPALMPPGLSVGAVTVWQELGPLCDQMGTLTRADVAAFATLCELEATRRLASLAKDGAEPMAAIALERRTAIVLRSYYALFGLEPVSRARIQVVKVETPVSKWA
jgi:phage terminase small subunit